MTRKVQMNKVQEPRVELSSDSDSDIEINPIYQTISTKGILQASKTYLFIDLIIFRKEIILDSDSETEETEKIIQ